MYDRELCYICNKICIFMKKSLSVAAALALSFVMTFSCSAPQSQIAVNPLTYTDIPDNDVIRVGDTYYMVSTTMYYCPGAPIMKSRDLVHWETVNYVFDCLEDDDVYNLRNGAHAYGMGQWAASLRYNDGVYYMLFVANDQHKTYMFRTRDIENGPWEKNEIEGKFMHDASLLFDEGRLFCIHSNGDIMITELEPDGSALKKGGIDTLLFSAPSEGYGLRAEGAHFYKIDGKYYVLEIDWPAGGIRTETCWRSDSLLGEYESRVVLRGEFDGRPDGVAQGAIVDTPDGDWYAIMFQDHGAVGRIPTVQPVTWVDGWPVMGDNTVPMKEVKVNLPASGRDYVWDSDGFDSGTLALVWQWNHKPVDGEWSLSERPGWMRIYAGEAVSNIFEARNSLTQRTVGPRSTSEVLLDASGMKPGARAGLCAFQSLNISVGVEVGPDGEKAVVARMGQRTYDEVVRADGSKGIVPGFEERVLASTPMEGDSVRLRIRYVFTAQEDDDCGDDKAYVGWSFDGESWTECPEPLQMRYTLDLFTGYRSMLYSYSSTQEGGYADFDYFRQQVY